VLRSATSAAFASLVWARDSCQMPKRAVSNAQATATKNQMTRERVVPAPRGATSSGGEEPADAAAGSVE